LLKNPLLQSEQVMAPFAREELLRAARQGQTVLLCMDQTDLGNRRAVLMVNVRVGDRSLPLAWVAEAGPANIGFEGQRRVLERVLGWLPAGAKVLLSADRFYPSVELFTWLHAHHWQYRLRLKGNLLADPGFGDEVTTGELAQGGKERYLPRVQLFAQGILTNLGIWHESGHPEPWIIAMDCLPTRAAVRDYGARWAIGVSGEGHRLQSVKVRPRPRDSSLVAREAPWRESKTAKPSNNRFRKEPAQRTRLQRAVNAEVASLHAIPVAETVDNARRQQGPCETSLTRRSSPAGYQRWHGAKESVATGEALGPRRRNLVEEAHPITVSGKWVRRDQGDGSGRSTADWRAAKRARREGPGPVGNPTVKVRQG
jgi:hypothetical protein